MAQDIGLGGAGALGAAFGGAPRLRREAYSQARNELARAFEQAQAGQKLRSETALNENRLEALQGAYATAKAAGLSDQDAKLYAFSANAASASNPEQLGGLGMRFRAADAARAGNSQLANQLANISAGKGTDMTTIAGNTAFNPNLGPDQAGMAPTAVGEAMMGADRARAQASRAQAGLYSEKANHPERFRSSTPDAEKPTTLTSAMRDALEVMTHQDNLYGEPVPDQARTNARIAGFVESHPNGATLLDALRWAQGHVPLGTGAAPPADGASPTPVMMPVPRAPYTTAQLTAPPAGGMDSDPRVQALLAQASEAVNQHGADPKAVEAMLAKQFAALGYQPQAVGSGR